MKVDIAPVTCYGCGNRRHFARDCRENQSGAVITEAPETVTKHVGEETDTKMMQNKLQRDKRTRNGGLWSNFTHHHKEKLIDKF